MNLTPGRIVLYKLSQDDTDELMELAQEKNWMFNKPQPGDVIPAIVVKVFSDGSFNGKAFLDGEPDLWITSIKEGSEPGQYQWPIIEKQTAGSYKVRYSRLFSLPNFENEKVDIERSFSPDIDSVEALTRLKAEVVGTRQRIKERENKMARYEELKRAATEINRHADNTAKMTEMMNQEMFALKIELDIKDNPPAPSPKPFTNALDNS